MESPMVVSSHHEEYGSEPAAAAVDAVVDDDDTPEPPTKQQKLIKAGLLLVLVVIVVYVILDYTVRRHANVFRARAALWRQECWVLVHCSLQQQQLLASLPLLQICQRGCRALTAITTSIGKERAHRIALQAAIEGIVCVCDSLGVGVCVGAPRICPNLPVQTCPQTDATSDSKPVP